MTDIYEDESEQFVLQEPLLDEIWVALEILPSYSVSNYGRVINNRTGNEKKVLVDKEGYNYVLLYRQGKAHRVFVHRIVAYAFFMNYKSWVEVKHISGDLSDNSVLNLTLGESTLKGLL